MSPFAYLGLAPDADERTIKRAYAQRLKQTRPDTDPEGFQRLNEAYRAALERRQHAPAVVLIDAQDDGDGEREGAGLERGDYSVRLSLDALLAATPPPESESQTETETETEMVPAPVSLRPRPQLRPRPLSADEEVAAAFTPPPARVDIGAVTRAVLAQAQEALPHVLEKYLRQQEDLYALAVKREVGRRVFEQIAEDDRNAAQANLSILGQFFGIVPPEWIQSRMRVRRAVECADTSIYGEPKPAAIRQLKRRFFWPQALLVACVPGMASRIATLARILQAHAGGEAPGVDPRQHEFFVRYASPTYFGVWKWATVLISSLVVGLLMLGWGRMAHQTDADVLRLALGCGVGWVGVMVLWHGLRWYWAEQHVEQVQRPWLMGLLPAWIGLLGLAVGMLPWGGWLGFWLAVPAAVVYLPRAFDVLRMGIGAASVCALLATMLPTPPAALAGFAGGAILMSALDYAYARHKRLRIMAHAQTNRWAHWGSYVMLGVAVLCFAYVVTH